MPQGSGSAPPPSATGQTSAGAADKAADKGELNAEVNAEVNATRAGDASPGPPIDVLLCYRGRYREQVATLAEGLRAQGLQVTYDREILDTPGGAGAGAAMAAASAPGPALPQSADPASPLQPETAPEPPLSPAQPMHWFSLGDSAADQDTAWRAPLQMAVGRAGLSVFLFDARSISANVMNEIAWVAQAGRPVFFVIDTGTAATSEAYECLVLGMLQAWYGLSRLSLDPLMREPGYQFLSHDEPQAMQQQLDLLLHRVLDYLARVRRSGVPTMRLDNPVTLTALEQAPLARARRQLHAVQAAFAQRHLLPERADAGGPDRFHEILAWNARREQGARVQGGWLQAAGAFHAYPEAEERKRFARTEAIIQRSRPGPHEVVPLYPGLARQAATLEMAMAEHLPDCGGAAAGLAAAAQQGGPGLAAFHPVVLLGTLPLAVHRSRPLVLQSRDHAELLLSLSFADACYQLIKLAVQAWPLVQAQARADEHEHEHEHPDQPEQDRPGVGFDCRPEAIVARIAAQPALVLAMQALLQGYCERGVPRVAPGLPNVPCQVALELLVAWAERFSVALGYAALGLLGPHPPSDNTPDPDAPPDPVADAQAATAVMVSAAEIDRQHAAQALQGCLFSVNADAVLGWALALHRPARRPRLPTSGLDPEAADARIARQLAQRQQALCGAFVALARRHGVPAAEAQTQADEARAAADTLLLLWQRAAPTLREAWPAPPANHGASA